jgi:hypothetical protein
MNGARRRARRAAVSGALVALAAVWVWSDAPPAHARPWKPTPPALAQDYSIINDTRNPNDLVMLWWLIPDLMKSAPAAMAVLDKYVVIGVVHAHVSAGGTFSFDKIDALPVTDADATPLKALTGDSVPPTVTGMLTTLGPGLRQGLGPMGEGIAWFVFESGSVHSCEKGRMVVPFAGETHTYDTPIPGCTKS